MKYTGGMNILTIDQGTTGSTVSWWGDDFRVRAQANVDFPQYFPQSGWVEHDLEDIWHSVCQAIRLVVPEHIDAIGLTNQRETVCFWDRTTMQALGRALVWQDRRGAEMCDRLKEHTGFIQGKTGLRLDPYFSATKIAWALQNWPDVASAAKNGRLRVGTIDTYMLARLTQGAVFATEPSNACRTMCFDTRQGIFSQDLCSLFGIDHTWFAAVRPSFGHFGVTKSVPGLPDGIPITAILGDQQAALLGQGCIEPGMAKCTFGTGAFMLMHMGYERLKQPRHDLLESIAWKDAQGRTAWVLEGSAFSAGSAIQWLCDGLQMLRSAEESEHIALSVPHSMGVIFVPALSGLGAPFWDPYARGAFFGLTRGVQSAHMVRAVLESIACQNAEILDAMSQVQPIVSLRVDGGASANTLLMQMQADCLQVPLDRPKNIEATSFGIACAAAVGAGFWQDLSFVPGLIQIAERLLPHAHSEMRAIRDAWKQAVKRVLL